MLLAYPGGALQQPGRSREPPATCPSVSSRAFNPSALPADEEPSSHAISQPAKCSLPLHASRARSAAALRGARLAFYIVTPNSANAAYPAIKATSRSKGSGSPRLESSKLRRGPGHCRAGRRWERLQESRASSAEPGRAADARKKLKALRGESFPHHRRLAYDKYKYVSYSEVSGLFFTAQLSLISPTATQGQLAMKLTSRVGKAAPVAWIHAQPACKRSEKPAKHPVGGCNVAYQPGSDLGGGGNG